jgi:hypothetical protein
MIWVCGWAVAKVDSESRFAIFIAKILWKMRKMRLPSRENISASLASLARREKCDILWSLRVSQFVGLVFASLTNKQSHNSQRKISVRLKILARFSQDSRVKISNDSRYEICLRDSREASLATKFLFARLVRNDSRYEISVWKSHEKRFSLLILTRESRENLARILGLESESRFSREFQKVILMSTLV